MAPAVESVICPGEEGPERERALRGTIPQVGIWMTRVCVSHLHVEHNVAVHTGEVKDECTSALQKGYRTVTLSCHVGRSSGFGGHIFFL